MADEKRAVPEKTIYVVLKGDVAKDAVISAVLNPTAAMEAMDKYQTESGGTASFVKVRVPKGAPRTKAA